ncbi:hypothetical protein BOH78_2151 [Pichia kudriavzevii]|uniref:Uncharacterized protein n=1 Tax=Pichia kudriavzevii TaxID=4909 RepID=A0A1V2LNV9_PICKU|nr:hypothetical protein BOH78_2151 [Pichia kudriavzevii]
MELQGECSTGTRDAISLVSKSHWPMRGRANSQWKVANVKLKENGQLSLKVETGNLCGFNMEKSLCKFNN